MDQGLIDVLFALFTTLVVPLAAALVAYLALRRLLPESYRSRYPASIAIAVAFAAGYALQPSPAQWLPERHWHWLPYLAIAAALVGPIGVASGVGRCERMLIHLLLAVVTAWLIVPTWSNLEPSRSTYLPVLIAYLTCLMMALDAIVERLPIDQGLISSLSLAAALSAAGITAMMSFVYGRIGGMLFGGLVGGALAGTLGGLVKQTPAKPELRALVPVYVVLGAGIAFSAMVDPLRPPFALLAVPACPLMLLFFVAGPLAKLSGVKATVLRWIGVGLPAVLILTWLWFTR